jgi:hypothetical protein
VTGGTQDTLEVVTGKINSLLAKLDKVGQYRITAGQLIVEAKARVEAGEAGDIGWLDWCRANITKPDGSSRSISDVYRLLKIGQAKDQQAAAAEAREQTREQVRRHRQENSHTYENTVAPPAGDDDFFSKLTLAWDLADDDEKDRFLDYAGAMQLIDPADAVEVAQEAVDKMSPAQLCEFKRWCNFGGDEDDPDGGEPAPEPSPQLDIEDAAATATAAANDEHDATADPVQRPEGSPAVDVAEPAGGQRAEAVQEPAAQAVEVSSATTPAGPNNASTEPAAVTLEDLEEGLLATPDPSATLTWLFSGRAWGDNAMPPPDGAERFVATYERANGELKYQFGNEHRPKATVRP